MIANGSIHNVLLSPKLRERARDKTHFGELISLYMQTAYPEYKLLKVTKDGEFYIAVCERK